jgi:hypothetical protein
VRSLPWLWLCVGGRKLLAAIPAPPPFHPPLHQGWREIIRFIPPLTISQGEVDTALGMLERGLAKAVATWKGPAPGYARKP